MKTQHVCKASPQPLPPTPPWARSSYSNGNHRGHPWLCLLPQVPYLTGPVTAVKTVFLTYLVSYQDGLGFHMMPRASKEKYSIYFSFVPFFSPSKNSGISAVPRSATSIDIPVQNFTDWAIPVKYPLVQETVKQLSSPFNAIEKEPSAEHSQPPHSIQWTDMVCVCVCGRGGGCRNTVKSLSTYFPSLVIVLGWIHLLTP